MELHSYHPPEQRCITHFWINDLMLILAVGGPTQDLVKLLLWPQLLASQQVASRRHVDLR